MKSKVLIELIKKLDPSGEEEVCVGNMDILSVDAEPAYYDGSLQVLERNENSEYYNVTGAKYRRNGMKIVITPLSITDAICNDTKLSVDYSELPEFKQKSFKEAHDALRLWHENVEDDIEQRGFVEWVKKKSVDITPDIESVESIAKSFYKENLSCNDSFAPDNKVLNGESYLDARERDWDLKLRIVLDPFLSIEFKEREGFTVIPSPDAK